MHWPQCKGVSVAEIFKFQSWWLSIANPPAECIEDISFPRVDMNVIFERSTRYLASECSIRVTYRVEHEKIIFVSTSGHVIFCFSSEIPNHFTLIFLFVLKGIWHHSAHARQFDCLFYGTVFKVDVCEKNPSPSTLWGVSKFEYWCMIYDIWYMIWYILYYKHLAVIGWITEYLWLLMVKKGIKYIQLWL